MIQTHKPTITHHQIDADRWATCRCGWTSSAWSAHDLEHQIDAHRKWWTYGSDRETA